MAILSKVQTQIDRLKFMSNEILELALKVDERMILAWCGSDAILGFWRWWSLSATLLECWW